MTDRSADGIDPRLNRLLGRWAALAGTHADATRLGDLLLRRWSEPHRRYHTVDHLEDVLARVDEIGGGPDAVRFAAWYHDAVYFTDRGDNEVASAELAASDLAPFTSPAVVDEVVRLVRLTSSHEANSSDANGSVLCDADLAVLGRQPPGYEDYRLKVRAEYAGLDDATWRAGRASVLTHLLGRPHIYVTPRGRSLWEVNARSNITREIRQLHEAGGG